MSGRRLFLDTNLFVASLTDEPDRGERATELMNGEFEFYTSLLNLMELRTVLAKKKRIEQERVEGAIRRISDRTNVVVHEPSDIVAADELQRETLLYPMDCLILALAEDQEATLVTFDSELVEAGASTPTEFGD
ncbi:type II toxin-antitoxin system VapC family toxin [Halobium palmae]|uniref:Ribonuclease VapC n=1 Tax=Halobium palmae TaxID=1776492 RepID=A0ABD5S1A5_9EURY